MLGYANGGLGGNAFEAEAMALRDGLELAWVRGFRNLICEVDSRDLLAAIQNTDLDRFITEIHQIRTMLARDWQVSVRGIHRDCNQVADFIAKTASNGTGLQVLSTPCHDLETLIMRDLLCFS